MSLGFGSKFLKVDDFPPPPRHRNNNPPHIIHFSIINSYIISLCSVILYNITMCLFLYIYIYGGVVCLKTSRCPLCSSLVCKTRVFCRTRRKIHPAVIVIIRFQSIVFPQVGKTGSGNVPVFWIIGSSAALPDAW